MVTYYGSVSHLWNSFLIYLSVISDPGLNVHRDIRTQTWMDMICVCSLKQQGYQSDALMTKSSRIPIEGSCKRPHSSSGWCLFSPWSYCSTHWNVINNSKLSVHGSILLETKFLETEAFLILIFLFMPNTRQCAGTQQMLDGWIDELRGGPMDE